MSSESVKDLLRIGTNLNIGGAYPAEIVKDFIRIGSNKGCHITLNGSNYSVEILKDFARIGGRNITIIL